MKKEEWMRENWKDPGDFPAINDRELHIWKADMNSSGVYDVQSLGQDEIARARRFRFEADRMMFIFSHYLLRQILAGYVKMPPQEIAYSYTKFGKPFLTQKDQQEGIEFNLSHSGDIVLIAVTRSVPLGVDVEKIQPIPDMEQIAKKFFSPGEQEDLSRLSGPEKVTAYYKCWTRKEAVIKACGEGLSMPLDSFQVSLLPGKAARLVHNPDARRWMLVDLLPGTGYAGAAASPENELEVSYFSAEKI
jgi:4'-phosphopantetheinyl transferase